MSKTALRERILEHLRATLALQVNAAKLARDEATNEESRAENQYDTHSLEAGYLAEGQARQAGEIEESIKIIAALPLPDFSPVSPIALGALVDVAGEDEKRARYFLSPRAGGVEVAHQGQIVLVVTPQSPLGRELLGRRVGDTLLLPGRQRTTARISAVM